MIYGPSLSPSQQLQVFSKTYFQQAVKIRGNEGQGGEPGAERCIEQTHLHLHYPHAPLAAGSVPANVRPAPAARSLHLGHLGSHRGGETSLGLGLFAGVLGLGCCWSCV